jgi:hypothetical protein
VTGGEGRTITKDSKTIPKAFKATSYDCKHLKVDLPLIDRHLLRIKSNTPLLQILLIYCESFAVATKFYKRVLWWGEMAPLPEKSPDLDNSSPVPRALMYVASLRTFGPSSSSTRRR